MQLLCLLIFIGATQCDDSSESKTSISPDCFDNLGVPNAVEYVSQYTLSVQTSYITSVECMLSSNHYIQSGFSEIDGSSNDLKTNLVSKFKDGFSSMKNMMLGLQQTDEEKLSQDKIDAVLFMTTNYYKNKNVTVKKSETKLSEVTECQKAQSILTAIRCESSYIDFMNDVAVIKTKYTSGTMDSDNINPNQWTTLVQQYYETRENLVGKTNVYASIREAFLLGSGINLCEGSADINQSLLKIYETDDLPKFFGRTDNDALALLSQTVTHMYTIYKASLTNIYLKSVVHLNSDLAMRVMMWEQVNLIRADFEYLSQNIVLFIETTQQEAKSLFGDNPKEYEKIMIAFYICVQKMLITAVKSTEVHYKRALEFNPDGSMIKKNFNKYKVDIIEKYYDNIIFSSIDAHDFDMRFVDKDDCSYPSPQMCIPQNMYSLVINKLVLQTFICQLNYIDVRIKTIQYDKKNVDFWIYEKITMVQFQNSIISAKCTATVNKIFIINSATYTFVLLITNKNTQPTDIQQIIDQSTTDIIGTLCVNTLEITDTFKTVKIFVDKNSSTNCTKIVYRPSQPRNSNTPPANNGNYPSNKGSYPPNNGSYPPNNVNYPPNDGSYPPNNVNYPPNDGSYPPNNVNYPPNKNSPANNGSYPPNNVNYPPNDGSYPPNNVNYPPNDGSYPPNNGNYPSNKGSYPPNNVNYPPNKNSPANNGSYPPNNVNYPPNDGSYPPNNVNYPPNDGSYPPNNVNYPPNKNSPANNGSYPPNNVNYPPNDGSYPPNNVNYPPSKNSPANNGSYPPNNVNYPPNDGSYPPNNVNYPPNDGSYPPNNVNYPPNDGSYPPNNVNYPPNDGSYPPNNVNYPPNDGSYPPNNGRYPSTIGNNSQPGRPTNNNPSYENNQYSFITSGKPITKLIEIIRLSSKNKITSCLTNVQSTGQTEYTKLVITSLELCQKMTQYNADYLESITSDSINYVTSVTTPGSQDYVSTLIVLFRDTSEKSKILLLAMDIPLKRTTIHSLTSNEYVYVTQTTVCKEFVNNIYKYFEVNIDNIYNKDNDADLYLKNSIEKFNEIYEMVVEAVKKTQDNPYKTFLLSYLEKTKAVHKKTTDCFREQIVQSQKFISQSGDSSKCAFYKEITQRMDSINIIYYGALIKSNQYAKDTSSVSIFVSEFDVITMQTEIVSSYTEITTEKHVEISVEISN